MTPEHKRNHARQLVKDEVLIAAVDDTLAAITKELLNAKTPEDREQKWHEYHGLKRAWNMLGKWAAEADTQ